MEASRFGIKHLLELKDSVLIVIDPFAVDPTLRHVGTDDAKAAGNDDEHTRWPFFAGQRKQTKQREE